MLGESNRAENRMKNTIIDQFALTLSFLALLIVLIIISIYHQPYNSMVYGYRVARVLSAVLAGAVLGLAGTYLQGCLRNPLVDHHILGIGSGALFTVYMIILITGYNIYLVIPPAIIGGFTALLLTITIAETIGGTDASYVLAGLGINSLFSGLSILLIYIVSTRYPFAIHLFIGSFINASARNLPLVIGAFIIIFLAYPFLAKPLNTLTLGDDYAKQLGYEPSHYRLLAITIAGSVSSIIVSCFGLIGFVGLVSPHIARLLLKTIDHRIVSPFSAIISASILLLTDDLSRIMLSRYISEIPAGAIVSIIGAPFFLYLLITRLRAGR